MFGAGAEDKILEDMKDLGVLMSDDEEPLGVTMAGIEDDGAEGEIGKLVISRRNVDGRLEASVKRRSWSPSMVDPETHVPVIHIPTNELRTGDEAPKAKDLAQFMEDNHDPTSPRKRYA